MGFLDWIKNKSAKDAEQAAPDPESRRIAPPRQLSNTSVVPKSVKPVTYKQQVESESPSEQAAAVNANLPEKDITFSVMDIATFLPEEVAIGVTPDTTFSIPSSDIAPELSQGRASIPVETLEAACPGIFEGTERGNLPERINLPLSKVVSQMGEFLTRSDQLEAEQPEKTFNTPFLQGALEDSQQSNHKSAKPQPAPGIPPALPIQGTTTKNVNALPTAAAGSSGSVDKKGKNKRYITSLMPDSRSKRRPPATVRASVAGGKIKVGGYTTSLIKLPADASEHVRPDKSAKPAEQPKDPAAQPAAAAQPEPAQQPPPLPAAPKSSDRPKSVQMPDSPFKMASPKPLAAAEPPADTTESTPPEQQAPATSAGPPKPSTKAIPFPSPFAKAQETNKAPTRPTSPAQPADKQPPVVPPAAKPPVSATDDKPAQAPRLKPAQLTVPATQTVQEPSSEDILLLPLSALIRSLPVDQIQGDPESISSDIAIKLPMQRVVDQLRSGKVTAKVGEIRSSLPPRYAKIFGDADESYELNLPLKDIINAIPPDYLRKRDDQIEETPDETYETPFSQKAQEDATRLEQEGKKVTGEKEPAADDSPPETNAQQSTPAVQHEEQANDEPAEEATEPEESSEPISTEQPVADEAAATEAPQPAPGKPSPATPQPAAPAAKKQSFISKRALRFADTGGKKLPLPAVPPKQPTQDTEPEQQQPPAASEPPAATAPQPPVTPPQPTAPMLSKHPLPARPQPTPESAPKPPPLVVPKESSASPASPGAESKKHHEIEAFTKPLRDVYEQGDRSLTDDEFSDSESHLSEDEERKLDAIASLKEIFMTEEKIDAKSVILHIKKFPGIKNALLTTSDGLKLAGSLSSQCDAEAISAISLNFISKVSDYAKEAGIENVRSLTLSSPPNLITLFSSKGACLIVEHPRKEFAPGTRSRLASIIEHLATIYSLV